MPKKERETEEGGGGGWGHPIPRINKGVAGKTKTINYMKISKEKGRDGVRRGRGGEGWGKERKRGGREGEGEEERGGGMGKREEGGDEGSSNI